MLESGDFESVAERAIREAIERGDFDDLPGKGRRIPGAGRPDDPLWWVRGWIERQRQIDRLDEARTTLERRLGAVWLLETEDEVRTAVTTLNRSRPAGLEPLEVDTVLTTWRAMTAARRPRPKSRPS